MVTPFALLFIHVAFSCHVQFLCCATCTNREVCIRDAFASNKTIRNEPNIGLFMFVLSYIYIVRSSKSTRCKERNEFIVTDTHLERHLENALFFNVYFYVWNSREPSQLELGKSII